MKRILFIVCAHGNELAPLQLFLRHPYGRTKHVEWEVIVANWRAAFLHTRFIDVDLNRIFAKKLDISNKLWEICRASELVKRIRSKRYDVIYDLHTASAIKPYSWPDCVFINIIDQKNLNACQYLRAKHVVWDSDADYNKQYLTSVHPVGITVEYQKTERYEHDVQRVLNDFNRIIHQQPFTHKKHVYQADKPVTQKEKIRHNLTFEDFKPLTTLEKQKLGISKRDIYVPVFVNPKDVDPKHYCFLNRKLSEKEIQRHLK